MFDLYLVRHAQTPPNAQRRYPALQDDPSLSELGAEQARHLHLNVPPGTQTWCSAARRCIQTAHLAGQSDYQLTPLLQEANFGLMAGHTWASLEEDYGDLPRRWIEALSDPRSHHGPPEGETGLQFHGRLGQWLEELPEAGQALAFTHMGSILGLLRLTVGLSAARIEYAKVTHLRRAGGQWWLEGLNVDKVTVE